MIFIKKQKTKKTQFFKLYIFIYLTALDLLQHVGSSSLTRNQTLAPPPLEAWSLSQ